MECLDEKMDFTAQWRLHLPVEKVISLGSLARACALCMVTLYNQSSICEDGI